MAHKLPLTQRYIDAIRLGITQAEDEARAHGVHGISYDEKDIEEMARMLHGMRANGETDLCMDCYLVVQAVVNTR